jgi:hypothetical protein
MTHRRVVAESLEYDFAPDSAPLEAQRWWSLFTAQVRDDVRDEPLRVPFTVRLIPRGEAAVLVKRGPDGSFALVTRPWRRFPPLALPAQLTVAVEAPGFLPLRHTFSVAYDTRTIVAPAPGVNAQTVTLNSTLNLAAGRTLLFGPAAAPQYVRIGNLGAGNQVVLESGLEQAQAIGDPVFPDGYVVPPPAVLTLRRAPVRIFGRVVVRDTTRNISTVVAGATIRVTDLWRTSPAVALNPQGTMTHPNPAQRQFPVAVSPGALAARSAGANAGAIGLPPFAGDDRLLSRPATGDTTRLDVSRQQNLAAPPSPLGNRLVSVEPGDPEVTEFQTLTAVDPTGTPPEPAALTTAFPLRHGHREGSLVSRLNPPGPLPPTPRALRDATAAGDRCVFLDSLGGLPGQGTLRFTGGGPGDEFQSFQQLEATSNVAGYYWLPPVHRIARLEITVDDGGGNVQVVQVDPEYPEPEQRLDFLYRI